MCCPMTTGMILVVDDDASLRKVLTYTLSEAGYEVLEAASGEEALDVLAAQRRLGRQGDEERRLRLHHQAL